MAIFTKRLGNINVVGEAIVPNFPQNSILYPYWVKPTNYPTDPAQEEGWVKGHCTQTTYTGGSGNAIIPLKTKNPLLPSTETTLVMGGGEEFGADGVRGIWKPNIVLNLPQTTYANFVRNYPNWWLGFVEIKEHIGGDPVAYCLMSWLIEPTGVSFNPAYATTSTICVKYLENTFNLTAKATETNDDYGTPSEPDGYGQGDSKPAFDHTSDTVRLPDKPSVSVTSAGFYHAYKVTQGLLQNFGAKLFPSLGSIVGDITGINDTTDVLKQLLTLLVAPGLYQGMTIAGQTHSFLDMILNGKAIDYVVDCHIIPVSPTVGGSDYIRCGVQALDISAPVITEDYIDYDCGSISIPENFQNYLDFSGTRAKLYLVGVGFVDIKPEFWNGGTLSVKYRFNILDGSFMCYVISTSGKSQLSNSIIGQYGGCMCLHIPVTGLNYASMISGLVTGSMSLAGNVASGNIAGAVGSALSVANTKPSLAQSNNYNSSTAFLGVRHPYLQIERQVPSFSARYNVEQGLPLNVTMSLGALSGFTIIENPQLQLTCDDDEREEIYRLLQSGVIF